MTRMKISMLPVLCGLWCVQVPKGTPPVRLIVSSTWRSGSTLLGEALAAHPGVFYHYEPLMPLGLQQVGPSHPDEVSKHSTVLDMNIMVKFGD